MAYLSLFADSIAEANVHSRKNWAVTYERQRVRLHVGHYIVSTLIADKIWLALDSALLQSPAGMGPSLVDLESWGWTHSIRDYPEYKDTTGRVLSKNGYYEIQPMHAQVWPEIRRLHFEFLYKAHKVRAIDPRTPPRHASGILEYLRHRLDRWLPDPAYADRE